MTSTMFVTFREAVASVLPEKYPQLWSGVATKIPNWEDGCILVEEADVNGNVGDGFDANVHRSYLRPVSGKSNLPIGRAEAAVNHNVGHRDTGWYTEVAIETGVTLRHRTVRVVHYPGANDPAT